MGLALRRAHGRTAHEDAVATVIARVLPGYRRRGYGTRLYEDGLAHARVLGAQVIETCVLAVNEDGLRFAEGRGFVEIDRLCRTVRRTCGWTCGWSRSAAVRTTILSILGNTVCAASRSS
ncbi:GNAT family N-acetyltransferase [Streptomyces sp. NPDC093591]|uniref:GNAT family N-acetyltransferase n=1 Tax=Streptomyces sp. NPDC093591 TaxID=3366044 RepID=UPI00382CC7EF